MGLLAFLILLAFALFSCFLPNCKMPSKEEEHGIGISIIIGSFFIIGIGSFFALFIYLIRKIILGEKISAEISQHKLTGVCT